MSLKQPTHYLYPIKADTAARHHPLIAMDVENDPNTGDFICASLYGYYKDHHSKTHKIEEYYTERFKLQERLVGIGNRETKNNPFTLILFNANYDLYFIREIVNDSSRLTAGSRFITARLKCGTKKGIVVKDLMNFVDGSLGYWIEILNMEKEHGIKKYPLTRLKERNIADTQATWYLGNYIEDFLTKNMKIPFLLTIAGEAKYYFQKRFLKEKLIQNNQRINDFERKSFRGGRTELFRRGLQHVYSYDVNSMYLSIMKSVMIPTPNTAIYVNSAASWEYNFNRYDTITYCEIFVPEQRIAPLPYKNDEGKLLFPTGTFRGYFCSPELKYAINYCGVEILEVFAYTLYKESKPLFKEFADEIWKLRQEYPKTVNRGMNLLVKKLGNALYGKFGQSNGGNEWIKIEDYEGSLEGKETKTDIEGCEHVYLKTVKEDGKGTFPVIPSFITSYGRLKLLRKMKQYEDKVVYCDTDSIHLNFGDKKPFKGSNELGEFGFEYDAEQVYYRPKHYGDKHKGIPKTAVKTYENKDIIVYKFRKPTQRKEAIRCKLTQNQWLEREKVLSKNDTKRVWKGKESKPFII